MVVPIVMVCGKRIQSGDKTNFVTLSRIDAQASPGLMDISGETWTCGRPGVLLEKFKLIFVGPGKFDPVAGIQGEKILTIDV